MEPVGHCCSLPWEADSIILFIHFTWRIKFWQYLDKLVMEDRMPWEGETGELSVKMRCNV